MPKRIVFISVRGFGLYKSRLRLIEHFIEQRWEVFALGIYDKYSKQLEEAGVKVYNVFFYRGGFSIRYDFAAIFRIIGLLKKIDPDGIHVFNTKPAILVNFAALFVKKPICITTITGLGFDLSSNSRRSIFISKMLKICLQKSSKIIFMNPDDRDYYVDNKIVQRRKTTIILGSGIELVKIENSETINRSKNNKLQVLFLGRLLNSKGIVEFIESARIIKGSRNVDFVVGGEIDESHPDAIDIDWFNGKVNKGVIKYLGYINNVYDQMTDTDIFVLPSHNEGIPRVILEASYAGVPVITTDVPGCRSSIVEGKTGLLVPKEKPEYLAQSILSLLDNPLKRIKMGKAGSKWIAENFDIKIITKKYLNVYKNLGLE